MTSIYIGLRYLFKKRLSYLAIIGVALSVCTLIIVLSVMRGFEVELRSVIRGYLSDLRVESPTGEITGMGEWQSVREEILGIPHIKEAAPFIESKALMRIPGADRTQAVIFRGMEPRLEIGVSDFGSHYLEYGSLDVLQRNYIDENEAEIPSVLIGDELAKQISFHHQFYEHLKEDLDGELRKKALSLMSAIRESRRLPEGRDRASELISVLAGAGKGELATLAAANKEELVRDEIVLMTASPDFRRRLRKFAVAGVFHTGRYDYDSGVVLMSLEAAQGFTDSGGNVSGLNVRLEDYYRTAPSVRRQLVQRGYMARTWEEQQRNFLEAVQMERVLMAIVLSFVGILAGFCIFAILITSVYEKRHDIGTMKAVGYTSLNVAFIFLVTGGAIGVIGTSLGIAGGYGFLMNINAIAEQIESLTGWTPFPSDVYYFTEIPVDFSALTPIVTGVGALLCSLAFSILPAAKAARMDPVETLRWE